MKRVFSYISQVNLWESSESVSGRGSEFSSTASIRAILPIVFEKFGITSILDAPCGDFNWMRHLPLTGIRYIGIDIVPEVITRNQRQYGTETVSFLNQNITRDRLPHVDLIISRDCLVHLPLQDACRALRQFKQSGSKYLLATTYPRTTDNQDAPIGSWKPLNLCLPPFNLCPPLMMLPDPSDDTGANADKSLGLWDLEAIELVRSPRWSSPQILLDNWIRQYLNPAWRL